MIAFFATLSTYGQNIEYLGLKYTLINTSPYEFRLDGPVDKNLTTLEIPDFIPYTYFNDAGATAASDCPVVEIGTGAFRSSPELVSVTMGNSVRKISMSAFESCPELKSIELSDNIETIGQEAIAQCPKITKIKLPAELKSIGYRGLNGNSSLREIIFNDKLEEIGWYGFASNENLLTITLPASLKTIGQYAFYRCDNLKKVTLLGSVEDCQFRAFDYDFNLKEVHVPNLGVWLGMGFDGDGSSPLYAAYADLYVDGQLLEDLVVPGYLTDIQQDLFRRCNSLKTVKIEDGIKTIGNRSFAGCKNLKNIDMGNTIESIDGSAFSNCEQLEFIRMSPTLKSISGYCFDNCYALREIQWSDCMERVGNYAFSNDNALETVSVSNLEAWLGQAFEGGSSSGTNPLQFAGTLTIDGERIEDIVVPDGITKIGRGAFAGAFDIKSLIIPNSVVTIGSSAFQGCKSLEKVSIGSGVTVIGGEFDLSPNIRNLRIDDGDEALTLSSGWGDYAPKNLRSLYIGREIYGSDRLKAPLLFIEVGADVADVSAFDFSRYNELRYLNVYSEEPPACSGFTDAQYSQVKLNVPKGSLEDYKNADVWKNFANISDDEFIDYTQIQISFVEEKTIINLVDKTGTAQVLTSPVDVSKDIVAVTADRKSNFSATINEDGEVAYNASKAGIVAIEAEYPISGSKAYMEVEVLPLPSKITIMPEEVVLGLGESIELTTVIEPENAYPQECEFTAEYNPYPKVSIEGNVVTGILAGSQMVYAKAGGKSSYRVIKVVDSTGVDAVSETSETFDIYTIDGILLEKNADSNALQSLGRGIYILKCEKRVRKFSI